MDTPTDPNALAGEARALFAAQNSGVLATLNAEGHPYTSLVEYAPLSDGDALFFLSSLAEHRRFLEADPRASLFVAPAAGASLQEARLSLEGTCRPAPQGEDLASVYLGKHPQAQRYIAFADFAFFRFEVRRLRFIAGFGRMDWIAGADFRAAGEKT